jgi:hypothetical protein
MILFKRVGSAFKGIEGREWALLALETLGVIAGILIAFELQEWAANRSDAVKHRRLMERLFEETEMDVAVLRDVRDTLRQMVMREQSFATALGDGRCPPKADWDAAQTFNVMPALTAPNSVYQELMGAGGLSSVERKDVRASLAQFHGRLDWSQRQIEYFRQTRVDPIPVQDPRLTVRFDPSREEPEVDMYDRQALCSDHAFRNAVAAAARAHTVFVTFHESSVRDAINMCVRLGSSLGRTCTPTFGGALTASDAKDVANINAAMREEFAKRD